MRNKLAIVIGHRKRQRSKVKHLPIKLFHLCNHPSEVVLDADGSRLGDVDEFLIGQSSLVLAHGRSLRLPEQVPLLFAVLLGVPLDEVHLIEHLLDYGRHSFVIFAAVDKFVVPLSVFKPPQLVRFRP